MTRLGPVRLVGAALIASAAAVWAVAGSATATGAHSGIALVSGDDRAVAHAGNVTTCEQAGLSGTTITTLEQDGYASQDNTRTSLTISRLPDGMVLTAIVVKGGPAYNVYQPGERGLSASVPYSSLRAPDNRGGNIPTISHWFACGSQATTPPGGGDTPPGGGDTPPGCDNGGGMSGSGDCGGTPPGGGDTPPGCDNGGGMSGSGDCGGTPPGGGDTPPGCDNGGGSDEHGGAPCQGGTGGPKPCDSGEETGNGSDCTPSGPATTPATAPATAPGSVLDDSTPPPGPDAKNLAQTGFGIGLPVGAAVLLLLVGGLLVAAPGHTMTLAAAASGRTMTLVAAASSRTRSLVDRLRRR